MANLPERLMVRAGVYYCRVWVPTDIACAFGKTSVVRSLRTRDPKIARSRLAQATVEIEQQFDRLRQDAFVANPLTSTTRIALADLAREYSAEVADRIVLDQAQLFEVASVSPERLWAGELTPLPAATDPGDDRLLYDRLVADRNFDAAIAFLQRFRLRRRVADLTRMRVTGNLGEFITLASGMLPQLPDGQKVVFALMLLAEEVRALQAGEEDLAAFESSVASWYSSPIERPRAEGGQARPRTSIDALFSRWEHEAEPSASTLSTWRGVVRNLKEHLGPKADDIRLVETDDIVAWKDKLVRSGKSTKTIGFGYLACARVLFRFAVANKLADADPAEGVKVARRVKAGKKMLGYESAEVGRILELASGAKEPWKRWLPWLAASTGSRIGEVAQLHGSHVLEREGIWVVKIAPSVDGGTIKNAESERYVPIHSRLIADGFLDFVRDRGEGPLFYNRTSGDPKRKHASKGLSNRLAAWIRDNGFIDPRKAPNHALRHWFKSEAARTGVSDSIADAIQGHSDGRAATGYRHISLEVMSKAIETLKLPPN